MTSREDFLKNIFTYLDSKIEIDFCRVEYHLHYGVVLSQVNHSTLIIFSIMDTMIGDNIELFNSGALESNLKEADVLKIAEEIDKINEDTSNIEYYQSYVHYYKRQK